MNKLTSQILKTLFFILLVAWLGYLLWLVRFPITYLLISAVISLITKPLVDLLDGTIWSRLQINRSLAAGLVLLIILGLISGLVSIYVPAVMSELKVLARIDFERIITQLQQEWIQLQQNYLPGNPDQGTAQGFNLQPEISSIFNLRQVSDTFTELIGGLGNLVFALFSILFITFFFLRERYLFRNIVLAIIPQRYEAKVQGVAPYLRRNLSRYFLGLLTQITLITTMVSLGLQFAGFHNTIVIGLFAGLINVIPYLGPIIGMVFGLVLGLAQAMASSADPDLLVAAVSILIVFGSVQVTDNFIFQPVIFSTSIRAHPLEIFLVISFAASLAGIAGMIVAVPVYSVLRLLAAEFLPQIKFVRWLTQNNLNDPHTPR